MKLPDKIFGMGTEEAYKNFLKRPEKSDESDTDETTDLKGIDEGDYILMPQHGIYAAKQRTHFNKNWHDTHKALHGENSRMLTLREFADFLLLLRNGNDEFKEIYKDITEVRDPYRAEWLDADFKVVNDRLHINYNHRIVNGELKPQNSEPLTDYLTASKTPGISLEDWLSNPTPQGLPRSDIKNGSLYYWAPIDGRVAGFYALSDGAGLDCNGGPSGSNASLGVRRAKIKV